MSGYGIPEIEADLEALADPASEFWPEAEVARRRLIAAIPDLIVQNAIQSEAIRQLLAARKEVACPYTFAHTKTWCGRDGCRER